MTDQIEPQATIKVDADETGQRRIMTEGANAYKYGANPTPENPYSREQESFWWDAGYHAARRADEATHEQEAEALRAKIAADQVDVALFEAQLREAEGGTESGEQPEAPEAPEAPAD